MIICQDVAHLNAMKSGLRFSTYNPRRHIKRKLIFSRRFFVIDLIVARRVRRRKANDLLKNNEKLMPLNIIGAHFNSTMR